jgi:hypothetical protein
MSAPAAMPENAESLSGSGGDRLKERLQKLLPSPITDRNKEALQKIDTGVRSKIDAEGAMKKADEEIVSGLKILDPDLKRLHKVCDAHDIIGEELGRADGQPVRRMVKPPKKDLRLPEATVSTDTEQPVQPAADASPPHQGRKVKWNDDRLDEDSYIKRAVEEAMDYLPVCDGEPHPMARSLVSQLRDRLGLAEPDSPTR